MNKQKFIPLNWENLFSEKKMINRSENYYLFMKKRRTVREFSSKLFPIEIVENCIKTAGTAPSGANKQPWHFVVVSNTEIKTRIRIAAEEEEKQFYENRAPKEWLDDLEPFGTDANKPFLEIAPYLIIVFAKSYDLSSDDRKQKNYYVSESVGIACGLLISAIHNVGLVSLTHTPSPMNFLNSILNRPQNERPYLVLAVGYPAENVLVPAIKRKEIEEFSTFL